MPEVTLEVTLEQSREYAIHREVIQKRKDHPRYYTLNVNYGAFIVTLGRDGEYKTKEAAEEAASAILTHPEKSKRDNLYPYMVTIWRIAPVSRYARRDARGNCVTIEANKPPAHLKR